MRFHGIDVIFLVTFLVWCIQCYVDMTLDALKIRAVECITTKFPYVGCRYFT